MITKQVSVFLENKSGRLNEVTQILGDSGINISAFTIADTSDFGIFRLIVSDPEKTVSCVKRKPFFSADYRCCFGKKPESTGKLVKNAQSIKSRKVFIEYLYAFSMDENSAVIVIRPTNIERCVDILELHKDDF